MKKKGFTLIELLVVIAIIAMLLAILMPALSRVKKIAQRVVCGTNLKGLGTAQVVYAHDYNGQFTVQGRGTAQSWDTITQGWQNPAKPWADGQTLTVGASLYLLVREADVSPKSFICPAGQQREFSGRNSGGTGGAPLDIVELWDFGIANQDYGAGPEGPGRTVSYSYHQPYSSAGRRSRFAADSSRSAQFAVMADRNPYFDPQITGVAQVTPQNLMERVHALAPYWSDDSITTSDYQVRRNNARPHDREGQNVLYADGHTSYENTADVGVMNDNIYIPRVENATTEQGWRQGNFQVMGTAPFAAVNNMAIQPTSTDDSYLINDNVPN